MGINFSNFIMDRNGIINASLESFLQVFAKKVKKLVENGHFVI